MSKELVKTSGTEPPRDNWMTKVSWGQSTSRYCPYTWIVWTHKWRISLIFHYIFKSTTEALGTSIWRSAIVTMTHTAPCSSAIRLPTWLRWICYPVMSLMHLIREKGGGGREREILNMSSSLLVTSLCERVQSQWLRRVKLLRK